jgi:menaquinone-dependent protoporphyrinogen oxidase
MEPIVLVTYATRMGSTEELALAVADALREDSLAVEVQPVKDVHSLQRYSAVVLTAPLYMFRLHKDARDFLSSHRSELIKVPVALFVPGPVHEDEKEWTGAREQLDKELARFPWLAPFAQHIVGGKFDPAKLVFPFNLIPPLKKMPSGDVRDWSEIRAQVKDFAAIARPALHH